MRSVSRRVRKGGALLLLFVALTAPCAYAEDDPEARARPPIGVSSATTSEEPKGFVTSLLDWMVQLYARARPPIG